MPTVVLDLRMVRGPLHGIARYALELARHLPRLAPDWNFIGLTAPEGLPENLGALTPTFALVRCRAGFLSPLEQPALAAALFSLRPSLFHATSFSVPALWPGPLVATLHDANHLALPHEYGRRQALYYRFVVAPRVKRASSLITISDFSRRELSTHLGLSPSAFHVVAQGVDASFAPPSPDALARFRARHRLPERYFAVLGNDKAYKNLEVLGRMEKPSPLPLVVRAGKNGLARVGFGGRNIALPPLEDEALPLFYGGAAGLLFPSRYEGFGLPVLEAMACGCPVVAARAGALPEVVGDAGLLAHPDEPSEWLSKMSALSSDEALGKSLREKGRLRAAEFPWETCARATLELYTRALGAREHR